MLPAVSWLYILFGDEVQRSLSGMDIVERLGFGAGEWAGILVPTWMTVLALVWILLVSKFGLIPHFFKFPMTLIFFPLVLPLLLFGAFAGSTPQLFRIAKRAVAFDVSLVILVAGVVVWIVETIVVSRVLGLSILALHAIIVASFSILLLRWAAEPIRVLGQILSFTDKAVVKSFGDEAYEKEKSKPLPKRYPRKASDPVDSFLKFLEWFSSFLRRLNDFRRIVVWLFTSVLCFSLVWMTLHYMFIYDMLYRIDHSYYSIGDNGGLEGFKLWFTYSLCIITTSGFLDVRPNSFLVYVISSAEVLSGILVLSVFLSQFSLSLDPSFAEFKEKSLEKLSEWIRLLGRWQRLKMDRLRRAGLLGNSRE